jgi:hypothetical protein
MKLRHRTRRALDWANGAGAVEEVGQIGDVHPAWAKVSATTRHSNPVIRLRARATAYLTRNRGYLTPPRIPRAFTGVVTAAAVLHWWQAEAAACAGVLWGRVWSALPSARSRAIAACLCRSQHRRHAGRTGPTEEGWSLWSRSKGSRPRGRSIPLRASRPSAASCEGRRPQPCSITSGFVEAQPPIALCWLRRSAPCWHARSMVGRLSYSSSAACASGSLLPIYRCNASVWGWLWGSWR